MKGFNRRSFLAGGLVFSTFSLLFGRSALAQKMREKKGAASADQGPQLVDPKDPVAASLGYAPDRTKVSKDKQKEAAAKGTPFAEQKCLNCSFYTVAGEKDIGGKKAAPCTVMANKFVASDAWCLSWNKKA